MRLETFLGMRVRNLLSIIFAGLMTVVSGQAIALPLTVDHYDADGKIAESWKLDGTLSCSWDKEKSDDLIVSFVDGQRRDLKEFSFRVPALKRYLETPASKVSLSALPKSEFNLLDAVGEGADWDMAPKDAAAPWSGSQCEVKAKSFKNLGEIGLDVSCAKLQRKNRRLSGMMSIRIHGSDSQPFSCKPL
jgi:hypothetical protein